MKVYKFEIGYLGSNCYILLDEKKKEAAVIDPGETDSRVIKFLEENEINTKYILLTHGHFDHILGANDIRELTGAKIAIHKEDAECLEDSRKSLYNRRLSKSVHQKIKPDILLNGGEVLEVGNLKITVMHTPGHSKGGVCYICGKNIFTGDTLFYRGIGRTDFPGGNMEELMNSVRKLTELEGNYTLYPGHNKTTSLEKEREINRFIRDAKNVSDN